MYRIWYRYCFSRNCKSYTTQWEKVLPVSTLLEGQYNERNVFAGVPCVIGKDGIEEIIEINMTEYEQNEFNKSCSVLRECIALSKTL